MQVGGDRRRRRHGVRQPEVERELRALREGACKHEEQGRQVILAVANAVARRDHRVQLVTAGDPPDQQDADQQAEPARGRDDQRHSGRAARLLVMVPVADQQEGKEARQFPEEGHLDQVPREDQTEHGAHEGEQERKEARHRVAGGHVIMGVDDDEESDRQDQEGEDPGKAVQPHLQIEAQRRQPFDLRRHDTAACHRRKRRDGQRDPGKGDGAGDQPAGLTGMHGKRRNGEAADEGKDENDPKDGGIHTFRIMPHVRRPGAADDGLARPLPFGRCRPVPAR
jgi:hypothetical protein